jgi:uncharacterized membrane protein
MSIGRKTGEALRASRQRALSWLRNWFLTGIVAAAPIGITVWLVWSVVSFVDGWIKPFIPAAWNPETYLPFALPGLGILVAVAGLTVLGALTANLIGRSLLRVGGRVFEALPIVRSLYQALRQVFETFASGQSGSFKQAVLVEYPRPGVWAIGFVTNASPGGEIARRLPGMIAVLIPTAPNPMTGFLIYVAEADVRPLDMSPEEAAKLIISGGILAVEGPTSAPSPQLSSP